MRKGILILAVAIVTMVAGCGLTCELKYSVKESERIAYAFVLQSPTYRFDGIQGTLELVRTDTLRCPGCWQFTYRFQSSHAGYGDRTGRMLAQVITPHECRITVQEYQVTKAIMDERWDMLTQSFISGAG